MSKKSFIPNKPLIVPFADENLVSYGDRLLWHQLGLQMNGHQSRMLSEEEYVATVCGFYASALEHNVRAYRSYFNSKQDTMGFRDREMPIPVEFAETPDVKTDFDRRRQLQEEALASIRDRRFTASDRLSRDDVHDRKQR
jgi:hypothetical protein